MGISVSGLASGLDIDGIINQLLALERAPIGNLQSKIAENEAKSAGLFDLDGRLSALRNTVRDFSSDLFGNLAVTSSDESLVTASATDRAEPGNYSVKVLQAATSTRLAAQGFADRDSTPVAAGLGSFGITIGDGDEITIDVSGTTTLRQLADAINGSEAPVRAELVNDGSPTNPFRLVLTGTAQGTENAVSITTNDTTLNFATTNIEEATADADNSADYTGVVTSSGTYTGTANTSFVVEMLTDGDASGGVGAATYRLSTDGGLTFDDNGGAGYTVTDAAPIALADGVEINFTNQGTLRTGDTFRIDVANPNLQTATDSIIEVNGLTLTGGSNTFTNVFDGVTFNIAGADAGKEVNINVARNTGDVQGALTSFIGAYNSVIGFINSQTDFDPASGLAAPPLNGESSLRTVARRLKSAALGRVPGASSDTLSALAEIGVESSFETGLLSLDTGALSTVLNDDPSGVERLLTGYGESLSDAFTFQRRNFNSQPGTYSVEVTQARTRGTVTGGGAAEVLAANEQLSFDYKGGTNVFTVDLLAGETPAQQVSRLNDAFSTNGVAMEAFLETGGELTIRTSDFGDEETFTVSSDTAAGAGTTNLGVAVQTGTGSDLIGLIGGNPVEVFDGNVLRGSSGFPTDGIEVVIPDGAFGNLGRVRIIDGLGESLPSILNSMSDDVIGARTAGIRRSVDRLQEQIVRQEARVSQVETRLRRQFVNLEVELSQLQSLGDYVSQQLSQLSALSQGNN